MLWLKAFRRETSHPEQNRAIGAVIEIDCRCATRLPRRLAALRLLCYGGPMLDAAATRTIQQVCIRRRRGAFVHEQLTRVLYALAVAPATIVRGEASTSDAGAARLTIVPSADAAKVGRRMPDHAAIAMTVLSRSLMRPAGGSASTTNLNLHSR
jgi:hypothetical protein